ncbi:MAG TPA: hypothetical protein VK483_07215 [Chitinophagaceae bacterium]|nr:hypothetical protein [Chitinophagaceae bacterium]
MLELKNIETTVLLTMLAAHSAGYRRFLTKKEAVVCKRTLIRLQSEIELRQKASLALLLAGQVLTVAQLVSNR